MSSSENIWVFQTAFVGDCVLSLPFLNELLKIKPKAHVRLVSQKGIQSEIFKLALTRGLSHEAQRIELLDFDKKKFKGLRQSYKWIQNQNKNQESSSLSFCLQRSFRTAMMALATKSQKRIGFSSGAATFLYTDSIPRSWDRGVHEIEKNLDLLRGVFPQESITSYLGKNTIQRPSLLSAYREPPPRIEGKVCLALGSPWATKRWPIEHAIELCKEWVAQGVEICLIGDPSARELAESIMKAMPSILIKNYVGQTNAQEWVDLIDTSSLLVSGDSASVHVASDLGVPVLAMFGPTIPEFGFSPWRAQSKVIQLADLPCRPCNIHGPKSCPLGHHKCMKDLGAQHVLRHAKSYLLVDPQDKKL